MNGCSLYGCYEMATYLNRSNKMNDYVLLYLLDLFPDYVSFFFILISIIIHGWCPNHNSSWITAGYGWLCYCNLLSVSVSVSVPYLYKWHVYGYYSSISHMISYLSMLQLFISKSLKAINQLMTVRSSTAIEKWSWKWKSMGVWVSVCVCEIVFAYVLQTGL